MNEKPLGSVPVPFFTLILLAIEACYFLDETSPWRRYAAFTWFAATAVMLITPWFYALAPFFDRSFWSQRHWGWYAVAFVVPPALLSVGLEGMTFARINFESTQELGGALHALRQGGSMGVFDLGYLRFYPQRQFLLASWPTCLFGPSIVALRMGYGLFYLTGYLSFLAAVRCYLEHERSPESLLLSSYAGVTISLATLPLLYARSFEQASIPLAATMFFLAGLLFFLSKPSFLTTFWVIWSFGFLPYCYTPALATWVIGVFLLLYLIIWNRQYRLGFALVYGIVTAVITYLMQRREFLNCKLHLGDPTGVWENFTWFDWAWRYAYGFYAMVGNSQALIPAPLVIGTLVALYLCNRHRDWRFFLVCLWACVTVAAAISCRGWSWAQPEFDIHRAMEVLPFLSVGIVLSVVRYAAPYFYSPRSHRLANMAIICSLVFMLVEAVPLPFLKRNADPTGETPSDWEEAVQLIATLDTTPNHAPLKNLYLIPPMDLPLEWGLVYFNPGVNVVRGNPPTGEKIPGNYLLIYLSKNPNDRSNWRHDVPSLYPRPYMKIEEE